MTSRSLESRTEQTEQTGSHGERTATGSQTGTATSFGDVQEGSQPALHTIESEPEPHPTQPTPTPHPNPTPTPHPRVIFMCAPPGSGKSTYAHRLASEGYTRLSIDDTAWAQGHRIQPLPDAVGAAIVRELDARLVALVRAGTDVVLDYSFWNRGIRDKYRRLLAREGVVPTTVYVRTPMEVGVERMRRRRGRHGDDFWLEDETVRRYWDAFEVPGDDEGAVVVVSGHG